MVRYSVGLQEWRELRTMKLNNSDNQNIKDDIASARKIGAYKFDVSEYQRILNRRYYHFLINLY